MSSLNHFELMVLEFGNGFSQDTEKFQFSEKVRIKH